MHSLTIKEKKLRGPLGLCHPNGRIEIDPRQKPREYFETLVHELLHREYPCLSEDAVEGGAINIVNSLWGQGYRKVCQ